MKGVLAAVIAGSLLSPVAGAQSPVFRASVDVVRVDVSVTDHGKPVQGLKAPNFRLTDNGRPVAIASVTSDQDVPLRIVLVLDTSSSVQGSALQALVDASRGLVGALRPRDRIAVLTFSSDMTLVSRFDASRAATLYALGGVQAGGGTSLHDALQVAFELVHLDDVEPAARPLIVICTDGHDTTSWLTAAAALDAARRADVVVEAVQPPGSRAYGVTRTLDRVVKVTGGRTWQAKSERDLERLFTQTLAEMRDRYLLTFSPASPLQPGWHVLKVSLRHAHGSVVARPGYYVAKAATDPGREPTTMRPAAPANPAPLAGSPMPAHPSPAPTLPPCCPTEAAYTAAVRAFTHGDRAAAMRAVAGASVDQLTHVVSGIDPRDQPLLEAAATMHLVMADHAFAVDPGETMRQLRASVSVGLTIYHEVTHAAPPDHGDAVMRFLGIWSSAAAELWMATGNLGGAQMIVAMGLKQAGIRDRIFVADGIVDEVMGDEEEQASADVVHIATREHQDSHRMQQGLARMHLGLAARAYGEALRHDPPDAEEARLRLGHVLTLEGKGRQAQALLEQAVADSHRPATLYLGHLFLADLAARRRNVEAAVREYQAAIAANPSSTVARIGLSNLAQQTGDDPRARAEVRTWIARDGMSGADPWRLYQAGVDQLGPQLRSLVAMVSR